MGRPGLTKHRKFLRLAYLLGGDEIAARGHLEFLWDAAYENGCEYLGDTFDVESVCRWKGEPGKLLNALLCAGGENAGFVEECQDRPGHYMVHDLFENAPEYVQKRMIRETERMQRGVTIRELRSTAGKKGRKIQLERTVSEHSSANGGQTADVCPESRANVEQTAANGDTPALAPYKEVPPISPPRGARSRKPKVDIDCQPEIEPHIDAVFELAPKAHPLTGEESPKGSRASARRAFQKLVDAEEATPLELEWAGRIYFGAEGMESEDERLSGMCEKLYGIWPYRKKALKHVATFYGPADKLYRELLPSARKLIRFLGLDKQDSMPRAEPEPHPGGSEAPPNAPKHPRNQPEPNSLGLAS